MGGVEVVLVSDGERSITVLRLLLEDRTLVRGVGRGMDLGVTQILGVDDRTRPRASLGRGYEFPRPSDISMCSVSVARLPGSDDMLSRNEAGAAAVVSTGCATMISSESPGAELLAIGIHRMFSMMLFFFLFVGGIPKLRGVIQMINSE